jgi:translation initiation factor 2 beta subunit (eIF-2beta)/eIF-5
MDVSSLVEMFAVSGTQEESIMNCIIQNVFRNENVSAKITAFANRLKMM